MFNLAREALIASGVKGEGELAKYLRKLDSLVWKYMPGIPLKASQLERARAAFDFLWRRHPCRYLMQGAFEFNHVIDAHFGASDQPMGNCLGLTVFYNCFLRRLGIPAWALYLENAFEIGPHVLTLLKQGTLWIDVENIRPDGFGFMGHKKNPSRVVWGDKELAADIYQSAGTKLFQQGELKEALSHYNLALQLNPRYEKARLNRAILLDRMRLEDDRSMPCRPYQCDIQ